MRKRRGLILFLIIALGGGTLWLLLGRTPIEEGRCRLIWTKTEPPAELGGLAWQVLEPQAVRPEGVRDLPAGFDRPCYYQINSAGRRIPLVASLSGRPRLCVAADSDGVLSRQQCWDATSIRAHETGSIWRFGPIWLAGPNNTGASDGGFYIDCGGTEAGVPLYVRPASFRTGKVKLDGRTYRVAVVDGDYDGRFHSVLSLPADRKWWFAQSDVFAIDLNGNGQFERSWFASAPSEVVPLGRWLRLADAYYTIGVAPDGTSLTFSRTEPPLGTLALEPNDITAQVRLWSDAAAQYLRGRQWQLPAGKYQGTYVAFEKTDTAGNVWSAACDLNSGSPAYPLGALKFFVIEPGRTTRLRVGPPLVVRDELQRLGPEVVIRPVVTGGGSERYLASFECNGQRVPEPTLKIVDEKGTVLVADKFRYG